ncbi:hypothetical protein U9M48_029827 [Paspalum notatum var. saurae]|uniref:Uncharacterized protein n=1 Tax=Paspalum notatum var. saurae TaxID=547442 RepID=A0AAQ3X1J3_PASNO
MRSSLPRPHVGGGGGAGRAHRELGARHRPHAAVAFVAASYLLLLSLFACLREYERSPPGSPARERARRAVWPLTALLTAGFAWKVASVMPSPAASAVVWALAAATIGGGGFALLGQAA